MKHSIQTLCILSVILSSALSIRVTTHLKAQPSGTKTTSISAGDTLVIRNVKHNKCIDANSDNKVFINGCDSDDDEQWTLESASSGFYLKNKEYEKYLKFNHNSEAATVVDNTSNATSFTFPSTDNKVKMVYKVFQG